MEAKGTTVATVGKFVRARFGEESHQRWLEALTPAARSLHSGSVMSSIWYPLGPGLIESTEQVCRLFYSGDPKGAWECGRFSAEEGLRGVYKIFLVVGTPAFIIKKASNILPQLYRPSTIATVGQTSNSVTLHVTQFPEPHFIIDSRIGGWMERALEISGCKGVDVQIPRSLARKDPLTEFVIRWS